MKKNYAEGQHSVEAMQLLQVDVFGLQEVNLNKSCPHIHHDVVSTFKINDDQAKLLLSTPPELFPTVYKSGDYLAKIQRPHR